MQNSYILASVILIPVLGAFLLPVVSRISERLRNLLAFVFILCSLAQAVKLAFPVFSGQVIHFEKLLPLGFNFSLTADCLAVFMSLASLLVGLVIVLYSMDYISHYENRNEYFMLVVLFIGSMMGIIFSSNLIFLYLFWEITAIVSWRLIGFFRAKSDVMRAEKAFMVTAFGAIVMLIGFIALYRQTGSFDLAVIKESLKVSAVQNWIVVLILCGIFSKSATLPFHTWLADAGVAPSPVTALLHAAVLVKIGVYVFARIFVATLPIEVIWQTILPAVAGASSIISAAAALKETDIKRIIAYSTISQIGFIFFGLSINNEAALAGGLLYIFMHGAAKAGLFLSAGIVEQNAKTKDITRLGGLFATMPVTGMAFLFCAASVMGLPPFGGFFSKYLLFMGCIQTGRIWLAILFLFAAFMTVLYLMRVFSIVFLGETKIQAKERSAVMVSCVVFLALLSLAAGIFINIPLGMAQKAAIQMMGLN
ncbi:MAG TPA: NADH-quinone oxidoreductase subunit L [Candidatus Omnitrophota bacterium]|nr:NADH-quinone oxidoreductase subunit L [Candidatus Omnitrophota bacterium]